MPLPNDTILGTRVVSLVPAATEVIFAIGRGDRLVGRTTWDTFPDAARLVANVGDGIRPNVEVVMATKPTLVLLYASGDNRAAAEAWKRAGIRVMAIRVDRIADFKRLTRQLGIVLSSEQRATQVVDTVTATLERVRAAVAGVARPKVVWPFWESPIFVVGSGSFIAELIDIAGGENIFADRAQSSVEVNIEEISQRKPQFVMTSPTALDRINKSGKWRVVSAIRDKHVLMVDPSLVGRPTVTLGMAAVSLAKLLHPDRASALP